MNTIPVSPLTKGVEPLGSHFAWSLIKSFAILHSLPFFLPLLNQFAKMPL
jgi:hypothetical protein